MPIHVTMALPPESKPTPVGDPQAPDPQSPSPGRVSGTPADREGVTPEQLAKVLQRLETGFYDRAEVRHQIARRLLDELDP